MNILICCTKKDYFFAKICVASIRYFYPDITIYLLKDELPGKFNTKELEQYWKVHLLSYPVNHFGWSAGKMFFYTDNRFSGQEFLVLDADIVFTGKLLDEAQLQTPNWDIMVSHEEVRNPYEPWFEKVYFNTKNIEAAYPAYRYPGYVFNCGQLFIRCGCITQTDCAPFFDFAKFPYWTRRDIFPLVDQSLFNFLLPTLAEQGKLKLQKQHYMLWSENKEEQKGILLSEIINKAGYPFLIHWAGAARTPYLRKMSRSDILYFFENYYYAAIPWGWLTKNTRRLNAAIRYYVYATGRAIKKVLRRG